MWLQFDRILERRLIEGQGSPHQEYDVVVHLVSTGYKTQGLVFLLQLQIDDSYFSFKCDWYSLEDTRMVAHFQGKKRCWSFKGKFKFLIFGFDYVKKGKSYLKILKLILQVLSSSNRGRLLGLFYLDLMCQNLYLQSLFCNLLFYVFPCKP